MNRQQRWKRSLKIFSSEKLEKFDKLDNYCNQKTPLSSMERQNVYNVTKALYTFISLKISFLSTKTSGRKTNLAEEPCKKLSICNILPFCLNFWWKSYRILLHKNTAFTCPAKHHNHKTHFIHNVSLKPHKFVLIWVKKKKL